MELPARSPVLTAIGLVQFTLPVRGVVKNPGFTAVAIFDAGARDWRQHGHLQRRNGVLLKPLPFPAPERLMVMNNSYPAAGLMRASTSPVDHADYRKHMHLFQEVMSVQTASFNYSGKDRAER
jgi:hypothetical protein